MPTNTPAPRRPLSAGSEIDAWCTRCKMDLGHRIVAMVGSAPKRVVCMTCGSEHNYREAKSAATKAAPKRSPRIAKASSGAKSKSSKSVSVTRDEWEKRVRSGAPLTRYSIAETFKEDQLITHKKFGDGFVKSVTNDKVIVVFIDGERTLVHGKS